MPIFNLATREDHIAPARSVFRRLASFRRRGRFRAGRLRPYRRRGQSRGEAEIPVLDRRPPPRAKSRTGSPTATETPGTWWPHWLSWIEKQAPKRVAAREAGGRQAPGDRGRPGNIRPGSLLRSAPAGAMPKKAGAKPAFLRENRSVRQYLANDRRRDRDGRVVPAKFDRGRDDIDARVHIRREHDAAGREDRVARRDVDVRIAHREEVAVGEIE